MLRHAWALLCLAGCAHAAPAQVANTPAPERAAPAQASSATCVSPEDSRTSAELIAQQGTVLDQYQREGGVWLARAPVLVNEDFDFALAMSTDDGGGAGLAAAKRKANNQQRAESLADLLLPPEARAQLVTLRCRGVHVFFLLWGAQQPYALKMIVDAAAEVGGSRVVEAGEVASNLDEIGRRAGALLQDADGR